MNRIVPTPSHHLGRCREFTFRGSPSTVSRPGAASPPGEGLESAPMPVFGRHDGICKYRGSSAHPACPRPPRIAL